jgi:hypothetical protein
MKITISTNQVDSKEWSKNGRSGVIHTQEATAENARFRQVIRLPLRDDKPIAPGVYECDLESNISVSQYGDLQLVRNLTLKPVLASAKAATA